MFNYEEKYFYRLSYRIKKKRTLETEIKFD